MSSGTWVRMAGVSVQLWTWSKCPGSFWSPRFSWRNCLQTGHKCTKCCILDEAAYLVCVVLCKDTTRLGPWSSASHTPAHLSPVQACELSRATSALPISTSLPWLGWDISLSTCLLSALPVMPAAVSGRRGSIKFGMNYHVSVADGTRDLPGLWWTPLTLWVTSLNCKGWINSLATMEFTPMTQGCWCFPFVFLNLHFYISQSHS